MYSHVKAGARALEMLTCFYFFGKMECESFADRDMIDRALDYHP